MAPIGVALIGGGLFAKMEHMVNLQCLLQSLANTAQPGIMKCDSLELKAIYSKSLKSAKDTAALSTKGEIDLYSTDSGEGKSLKNLLARHDISAVIITLPIATQPPFIELAIRAGKHVLAEKPIAPDVDAAKKLVDVVSGFQATYSIAENYRFIPKFIFAAEESEKLGKVEHFSVKVFSFMPADSFWYETEWRRNPQHQGGPLLDGGVHYAAATRLFLKRESKATSVHALTNLTQQYLPPIDTVNAVVKTDSGASGTVQFSFGSRMESFEWDFAFEKGSIKLSGKTVTVKPIDGDEIVREFPETSGVGEEIAAWAEGLVIGKPDPRQSPQEAMADVEFLEMMFRSGEDDGASKKYTLQ